MSATSEAVAISAGDRVYLETDPRRDMGRVVELPIPGRAFVRWENGRTWIYATSQLVRVEPAQVH